jgi:hypothetical protein
MMLIMLFIIILLLFLIILNRKQEIINKFSIIISSIILINLLIFTIYNSIESIKTEIYIHELNNNIIEYHKEKIIIDQSDD